MSARLRTTFLGALAFLIHASACGEENLFGLPDRAFANNGALLMAGGGRLPEVVYDRFVELAGGKRARLVIVPWAHPFSSLEDAKRRYGGWLRTPVASVRILEADTREKANDPRQVGYLAEATGVWLAGGGQNRLVRLYRGTEVEKLLLGVLERGGVIGGTSAGAMAMSQTMLRYDQNGGTEAAVGAGFGLIKQAMIDTHFKERKRHGRLFYVLERHPNHVALGIDEGTAIVVQGNSLQVLGKSQATLYIPQGSGTSALVHRLASGETARLVTEGSGVALQRRGQARN
jgi:cyanophycinase